MSQAESSTNVADVAAASQPPTSSAAVVAKLPADPAVAVSAGPPAHPAIWGISVLVFAVLFLGGVYIGQDFLVDRSHNAGLYVEPKYLDFGEVWAEEAFKWRIPIQNKSDREVGIAEFTASCQCDLIEPPSLTMPPHSTAEVVATINLTNGRDIEPYGSTRKFEIAIHPIVAVPTSRPPGFVLRGKAKDPFIPSPRVVDLGEILTRTVGEPKSIRLKAATSLASVTALPQPDMTIEIQPAREGEPIVTREGEAPAEPRPNPPTADRLPPALGEYFLTVTPSDQIPTGEINRTILIAATDVAGKQLPHFPIKVTGEVVFGVGVEPRRINVGMIELGNTFETLLSIRSRTQSRFALVNVEQESGVTLEAVSSLDQEVVERADGSAPEGNGSILAPPGTSPDKSRNETGPSFDLFLEHGLVEASIRLRLSPRFEGDQNTVARVHVIDLTNGEHAVIAVPIVYYGARRRPARPEDLFIPAQVSRL